MYFFLKFYEILFEKLNHILYEIVISIRIIIILLLFHGPANDQKYQVWVVKHQQYEISVHVCCLYERSTIMSVEMFILK